MSEYLSKLDLLDRRLLRELDRNCRQSYASLERKLHAPAETLRYRTNVLINSGIIAAFVAVVDAGKLGCSVHKALLKLHNVHEKKVAEIVQALVQHPQINWVVRLDGLYDLSFTIWVRDIGEVSRFVDDLKSEYHLYINRLVLAVNIGAEFMSRDLLRRGKRRIEPPAKYSSPEARYQLDRTDFQILKTLAASPRGTATQIAEQAGVSSETVGKRIRNMEKAKIITGYRIVLNSTAIGELNYYILIYLRLASAERIRLFVEHCRGHPQVNYIIKALGEWDYELNVEAQSVREFRAFVMDLTREFSDIVREYHALPVTDIYKFMIMPPGAAYQGE